MNVKTIIDEVHSNIRPSYPGYMEIPKEEIRRQILFGLQRIGRETEVFKKYASYTCNSTSQEVTWDGHLNTDYYLFHRPLSVRYASNLIDEIDYKTYPDLGDATLDAENKVRYFINDVDKTFGLYNYVSGNLIEVEYTGIPSISAVSDGASPLPQEFDEDLIGYVSYKMLLRSPEPNPSLIGEYKQSASGFLRNVMRAGSHSSKNGQLKMHEWG